MYRCTMCLCALAVACAIPAAAIAQDRRPPPSRPAPASRPAPSRPAPAPRPAPQPRPAAPSQGFNFNRDIAPRPAPVQQRAAPPQQAAPQRAVEQRQPPVQGRAPGGGANYRRAPITTGVGGPYHDRFHGPVVRNPHAPGGTWGWNHGVAWRAAPIYWGGGFWGPFAAASLADALLYGEIVDDQDQVVYPSYQVEPDTPGADLLDDYGLQQTQCGPPNLVVIWGPDNSVICALPNDSVAPGNYEVDPSTLTLIPASP